MKLTNARNACARHAWKMPIQSHNSTTRRPPIKPWTITATVASTPSTRIHRRRSTRKIQPVRTSVINPTADAIRRWTCSNNTPPTQRDTGKANML